MCSRMSLKGLYWSICDKYLGERDAACQTGEEGREMDD